MFKEIKQEKIYLQILNQIKSNIINKTLKSGDRLPSERQLAETLGVSRATVREAIRSLEMIGLVSCRQGEGNFINEDFNNTLTQPLTMMFILNEGKVTEIHELRRSLETEATRLAATRISPEGIIELEELCTAMENNTDEAKGSELDKAFHYKIAEYSENSLIKDVLNSATTLVETVIQDLRIAILLEESDAKNINLQHREILDALKSGSSVEARRAMANHMNYIEKFILKMQ